MYGDLDANVGVGWDIAALSVGALRGGAAVRGPGGREGARWP
jgi:hypothetical protein